MKKVGVLAFANIHTGGVLQYTQTLIEALNEGSGENYKLVVFTFKDCTFDSGNAEVRVVKKPNTGYFKKSIIMAQLFFNLKKKWGLSKDEILKFNGIDLFFNPTISLYPNFYLNTPFIFTLHDFQERYYPKNFSKVDRITRWLMKKTLSNSAQHIICESNYVKEDILNFLRTEESMVSVVPSPPVKLFSDFCFYKNEASKVKLKYSLPDQYIFYPAQFWIHKNHIRLIHAFSELIKKNPELHLVITGVKENNYWRVIETIKLLNVEDKVLHLGYVDQKNLPYIYKMSKLLVMPTLFESISVPIYEAFSIGVPVCSSNVVALPEQTNGGALLFNPKDTKDIENKIQKVLSDSSLQEELIRRGRLVIDNLDNNKYAASIIKIVLKFLK